MNRYATITFPLVLLTVAGIVLLGAGCETTPTDPLCTGYETRAESIPADAVKQTPETDLYDEGGATIETDIYVCYRR